MHFKAWKGFHYFLKNDKEKRSLDEDVDKEEEKLKIKSFVKRKKGPSKYSVKNGISKGHFHHEALRINGSSIKQMILPVSLHCQPF